MIAAATLVAVLAGLGAPVGSAHFEHSCGAVTKVKARDQNVAYRVRCNFSIDSLVIRTSRRQSRVDRRPTIDSLRAEDRLDCERKARRRTECAGDLSVNARIRGAFRVPGDPCEGLVARFGVRGGACTDDVICIDIAYFARVRVEHPRGC